jgi:hypothetical protein
VAITFSYEDLSTEVTEAMSLPSTGEKDWIDSPLDESQLSPVETPDSIV